MKLVAKFLIIICALAGFQSCRPVPDPSPWDLIDANSIFVFESQKRMFTPDSLLNSFLGMSKGMSLVALQSSTKSEYELLHSFAVPEDVFLKKINSIQPTLSKRLFNGFDIYQTTNKKALSNITLCYINGFLTISPSPLLVEKAIRIFADQQISFRQSKSSIFQFPSVKGDDGNLYVNILQVQNFLSSHSSWMRTVPLLNRFASSSMLDVSSGNDFIYLAGFTLDSIRSQPGLHVFQKQRPVLLQFSRFIPNQISSVVHFGISDFSQFHESTSTSAVSSIKFGDEFVLCAFDENEDDILGLLEIQEDIQDFSVLESGDYLEEYSGYQIKGLREDVLMQSLRPVLPKKQFEFFVLKDNSLLFASSVESLKTWIDAIEADETWGTSIQFQNFYENGLKESNVSVILRSPRFPKERFEKWSPILDSLVLSTLSWAAIQFSSLDNHFYTNVNLSIQEVVQRTAVEKEKAVAEVTYGIPNSVASAHVVKNHNNGSNELLVQDSTYRIFLTSHKDGVIWQYTLDGMIKGRVQQVDLYKNGKLQYFITTTKKLYVIDRLGRDVSGFPQNLTFNAQFAELVDYDKSKNYRYLLSSNKKELFILDKEGTPLDGWAPKLIGKVPKEPASHYKIAGKDYFIVHCEDGTLFLLNRAGANEPGFPIALPTPNSGTYFLETGTSFKTSFVYVVSAAGQVTKQALDGSAATREELVRGKNSRFVLTRTDDKKDFFYVRIDEDKLAVFDKRNNLIFERENPGSVSLVPTVFSAPGQKEIFGFFDQEQNMSYFYDALGNAVFYRPMESTLLPLFGWENRTKKLSVFTFSDQSITVSLVN